MPCVFCYAARVWRKLNSAVLKPEKTAPKFAHCISSLFRKPRCWRKCRKVSPTPRLKVPSFVRSHKKSLSFLNFDDPEAARIADVQFHQNHKAELVYRARGCGGQLRMLSISNGHLYSRGCWRIAQCSWNGNTSSVLHVDSSNDDGIALYPETL